MTNSKKINKWFSIIFLLCILFYPAFSFSWERSTPNVPPDSFLYRDLDKLVALGLVHPPILGQRPYPRSEFARLTAEAIKNYEAKEPADTSSLKKFSKHLARKRQIENILKKLKTEFKEELIDMGVVEGEKHAYRFHPLDEFIGYFTYLNSPPTTIIPSNGVGVINAVINPLGDYNLGRNVVDGTQFATEFTASFQTGRFFSGYVRPRFEADIYRQNPMAGHVYLQNAYGIFKAGNFAFEFGRDSMIWGIGERGGLLFSTNARPLDGVRITNPTPARLPWVFKYLGEWRYTFYAANLGPDYPRKWAWLAGYKLSLEPARYVEIGFGHVVMIGGEGAPTPSFLDVVGEFIGFRPGGTDPGSPNITNHIFEIEGLVRIPQLRGFQIYGDVAIDDKWKSFTKTLIYGCSYLGGIYLPALNSSGSADLRIELVKTSAFQYRHSLYADGYTLNRRLIGTDAGPDAYNVHAVYRHTLSPKVWYGVSFDWDYRRSDTYTSSSSQQGLTGSIVKTATGPTEERYRGLIDLDWQARKHLNFHLTVGYERVKNLHYIAGSDRNNYLAALSMKLDLDRYFGFVAR